MTLSNRAAALAGVLAVVVSACTPVRVVLRDLEQTEALLEKVRAYNGDRCAPVEFANATSDATFARVEMREGHAPRAAEHVAAAWAAADEAWKKAEGCGGKDYDGDKIPDVIDRCPQEAEDFDGTADEDGCPDIDPYGDLDQDGVRNIDDGCPKQPEDFDGHNDEDGCPETSDDTDGDGIIDATDKCPTDAEDLDGFKDADGCPDPDNDRDGIIDIRDACPMAAEDTDDWEDSDGCPEWDNDRDGIEDIDDSCPNTFGARESKGCPSADRDYDGVGDAQDKCPEDPETRNGYLDEDGCPDDAGSVLRVGRDRIELPAGLDFAPNTSELAGSAYGMLDEVARLLREAPAMRLRIEGHTDASGDEGANVILSRRRAEVVRDYLVSRGVDTSRLEVQGYGSARPIDTNRTEEGRAHNRRIELVITAR